MQNEEIKKKLEDDLRAYINDPSTLKPYVECMQEIDVWLNELKK